MRRKRWAHPSERIKNLALQRVELTNFKAFERYTCHLREGSNFLLGPNNAGKSTLIAAIRTLAAAVNHARQRKPEEVREHRGSHKRAFPLRSDRLGLKEENLAYEMRGDREVTASAHFREGLSIVAVWPSAESSDPSPFFYLESATGGQPARPRFVRDLFPTMATVPMLSPLEPEETILSVEHVRGSLGRPVTSRHFRNLLGLVESGTDLGLSYEQLAESFESWCPELRITAIKHRWSGDNSYYDVFYEEPGRRAEKELSWAGDGIQVWLQLLFHVQRLVNTADIIVLDEPDLYLHADLQRRLVRFLDDSERQIILSTHAPEIVGEAEPDELVWVDKSRRRSVRRSDVAEIRELSADLGTQFDIGLARALRAPTVLFVEGDDMKTLRILAGKLGLKRIAEERDLAVVPLEGRSQNRTVNDFTALADSYLHGSVKVAVILDRDYWSDPGLAEMEQAFASAGILGHVWRRKELESYMLEPSVLSRAAGLTLGETLEALDRCAELLKHTVFSQLLEDRFRESSGSGHSRPTVTEAFAKDFDTLWDDRAFRLHRSPPKKLLKAFNRETDSSLSWRQLARTIRASEIASEMQEVLAGVEGL